MSKRARLVVLAGGVLMAIAVVATARAMPAIVTSSDLAVTELYTELATRAQLQVGPDSRFGWNHPGPLYFYILAPLYAASGHRAAALFAAAVAINLAAVLTIVWVVSRQQRGPLLVMLAIACLVLAWKVPRLLASPWTAHIPVLTSVTFIVVCGAVVAGRHRLLLLMIFLGSFITQTHLAFVPMVAVLSLGATGAIVWRERRQAAAILSLAAGLWLLLWLPVLMEAVQNGGGNIALLWDFFVASGGAHHSIGEAFANWSYALSAILKPDLSLPWGGHFIIQPAWWRVPIAVGQIAGLVYLCWWSLRSQRQFEAGLSASAALASLIGLAAITRIHGDVVDHELFGLVALGAFNLAILAGALMGLIWRTTARGNQAAVTITAAALAGLVAVGINHLDVFTSFEIRRSDTARIPATYEVLRGFFEQRGIRRPLFQMDGDSAGDATAILLRVLKAGWPLSVEEVGTTVFPAGFGRIGTEDAVVNFSGREGTHLEIAARPGNIVLRDRHPLFVDVVVPARKAP